MHKSFRYQLPFLLSFCLFTNILPAAGAVVCPINVKGFKIAGYYNSDGSNGRSGRDGRKGRNETINADGSVVNFDLSGQDGEDGEDGEPGYRPSCRNQQEERDHINAANGGNGGSGGKGGNGGNGGDITVYYGNLADLKKIALRAVGGEGGRGGRGARGAAGCSCRRRRWHRESCTGNSSDRRCTQKVYRCYNGRDGSDGRHGRDGTPGRLGILSIVNSKEFLADDQPTAEIGISQLANREFSLSKNKWQIRQGATSLLAIGSIIADNYREFERRLDASFKLVWLEKKPITNFVNQSVKLTLNDNEEINIDFSENLWIDGTAKTTRNLTEYTVNHAIPQAEATKLAVAEFANSGENLSLRIVDLGGNSDVINTRFRVKYRARDNFDDSFNAPILYEGEIPSELVSRRYNNFTLALGKLKIPGRALNPGVKVDIEVVAIRSLGGRSAQQKITWQGVIRNQ